LDESKCRTYINKMYEIFSITIDTLNIHDWFSFNTCLGIGDYDLERQGYPFKINNYINTNTIDKFGYLCTQENKNNYSFLPIVLS